MTELTELRKNLDFYMKRCAQLEKELHNYKVLLGHAVSVAKKTFKDRKQKLARVAKDLGQFIYDKPGHTTKWYAEHWPLHQFGYKPTTWDNRIRDLRDEGLITSIVHIEDGLQHHYPKIEKV